MQLIQDLWTLIKPLVKQPDRPDIAYQMLQVLEDNGQLDPVEMENEIREAFGIDPDLDTALEEFFGERDENDPYED